MLEAGKATIGDTSVRWEGNTPLVTFPIPGVAGATAVATLNEHFMATSIVVKHGRDNYEFTYSDYDDHNNELNRIEAQYAGKMVERRNGQVVRDIETVVTELKKLSTMEPQPEVHIRGDQDARYESVGRLVVACQRAGIAKVGFITEPPPKQ